jgi:acylphosphatase
VATIRRRVLISGLVQGVWFRQTTAEVSRRAGLAGWVRNLPDGRVEAVFEGEQASVESVIAWCHRGPSGARVDAVEIHHEELAGGTSFTVRA